MLRNKPTQTSVLNSAPASEVGTNAPKDLGRPFTTFLAVFSDW